MDELDEQMEHDEFMDSINKLQEQIFLAWMDQPAPKLLDEWFDIKIYGDEPAFTSVLFDSIIEEDQ